MAHAVMYAQLNPVAETPTCLHCGTVFKPQRSNELFCCHGCETVFHLLKDNGLDTYYALREQSPPTCPLPAQVSNEAFLFCDDPDVIRRFAKRGRVMDFFVEGLNCAACLWLLEKLPTLCSDIEKAEVNFSTSTVRITRTPTGSFSKAAQALNRIGYRPHLLDASERGASLRAQERRRDLIRIGVAAAATGNIMIFSVSLYGGAQGFMGDVFQWICAALAIPSLTYCAYPFYKSAFHALRSRSLNLDVPIVAALFAGIAMSAWNLARGNGAIYFDSLTMLVFLLLSSRTWFKGLQQHHLDLSHLEDQIFLGSVKRVKENGEIEIVSNLSLQVGDVVQVQGSMLLPADGILVEGRGRLQASALTGESEAVSVSENDLVFAGTENVSGTWLMRVTRTASDSRFAQILREAEQASKSKPEFIQFADLIGRGFVTVVFVLALGIAAWFAVSDTKEGLERALALVIVTCPCVFGMAIPLSLSLAVKAAARRGLVIKNGDVIERIGHLKTIVFDKTGTLTKGHLSLLKAEFTANDPRDIEALLALEKNQDHPVSRAFEAAFKSAQNPSLQAHQVTIQPGRGLEGLVNGTPYALRPIAVESETRPSQVRSRFALTRDGETRARFDFGDDLRDDAKETISALQKRGLKVFILSGDRASVVTSVTTELGLAAEVGLAECSPEEKQRWLREAGLSAAMVGDGANDAAALASSSVGIAMRGSLEASLRAADVYLLRPELKAIVELFEISDRTRAAIKRNLIFSVLFNVFAGALALTGHMQPLWAAVLMPASSLIVLLSALATGRSLQKKEAP